MFLNNRVYIAGVLKTEVCVYPRIDGSDKLFGIVMVSIGFDELPSKRTIVPVYLWSPAILKEFKHHSKVGCRVVLRAEIDTFGDHILLSVTRDEDIEILRDIEVMEEGEYKIYAPTVRDIQQAASYEGASVRLAKEKHQQFNKECNEVYQYKQQRH